MNKRIAIAMIKVYGVRCVTLLMESNDRMRSQVNEITR